MSLSRDSSSSNSSTDVDSSLEAASTRFIFDYERSSLASKNLMEYVRRLSINWRGNKRFEQVRDDSLAFLKQQRESEYYLDIKSKIADGEKVTPSEYYYFTLTTENLQLVDVEMLEDAQKFYNVQNCEENLMVVKAALHYQHAKTAEDKKRYQQDLADAIRFDCPNRIRPLFLNLAGIDISGADLMDVPKENRGRRTNPHLNLVDLSGAKLDGCNMFALDIEYSDLSRSSFRNVFGDRRGERYGPRILAAIARNACFDGIELTQGSCQMTDFTGSSFKHANAHYIGVVGSIFDGVDFEGATIKDLRDCRDVSFKNAILYHATLIDVGFRNNDFSGARLVDPASISEVLDLDVELSRIADASLSKVESRFWWAKDEVQALQNVLAKDVVRCLEEDPMDVERKREICDAAANHPLFYYGESTTATLTAGAKSIYNSTVGTLFGKYQSDNPAVKYLEDARDQMGLATGYVVL